MSDPVGQFEHSHGRLTKLALEVRQLIRADSDEIRPTARTRKQLTTRLQHLRDELLEHFANEEEGLFPFLRSHVPASTEAVERLEAAHDAVCGSLERLTHFVIRDARALDASRPTLITHYERFESAYTGHSQEEAVLFEELGRALDEGHRAQLAELLRGL